MIGLHREIGGMHGPSQIVSCVPRLTIVSESTVFRGIPKNPIISKASGFAERVAALHMIEPRADRPQAITLGADKAYDAEVFVNELRSMNVTPHVAQNHQRPQFSDRRTHDPAQRLCRQSAHPQAHRRGVRLDQDGRWPRQDRVPWP